MPGRLKSILDHLDGFTLVLLLALVLSFVAPVKGSLYDIFYILSKLVVALLFFLHGAKLSPQNIKDGFTNYKLQLLILVSTFVFFPLAALALKWPLGLVLPQGLVLGFLFLACLPSTVQSSIAFTSIAKGNVAAAVCAASASSLLGVVVTPFLVGILVRHGGASTGLSSLWDLTVQLVLPFALGQLLRPKLKAVLERRKKITDVTDRLSVVFIVFVSFSHATNTGLWKSMDLAMIPALIVGSLVLLALALIFTWKAGGLLGFAYPDRAAILFCGSKKSLMAGVPMANIILPPDAASLLIIPLMCFHQVQLIACAMIAKRLARRQDGGEIPESAP
ncbi:MAG: bile acid:sodium symporter [Deltaproteobacteria bacterium]|jgi:sodium/bile acid cotransporter 7|nr:bile acid:sodium symporter [Deltaproteobacteria bacterium]